MTDTDDSPLWYPTVDDVVLIHDDVVREDPDATPGSQDERRIQFAIESVQGAVGEEPGSIHAKAFHLMRLLAANHWFADGNKRTALNVTELFYLFNGFELDYGDDLRSMLKLLSVRQDLIDAEAAADHLRQNTSPVDLESTELAGLVLAAIAKLVVAYTEAELDDFVTDSEPQIESVREGLGLTTDYGTTVNLHTDEDGDDYGG